MIFLFLLLIIFFSFPNPTYAGKDITITCTSNECFDTDHLPLFDESNIYPGLTSTQQLNIINLRSDTCNLVINATNRQKPANKLPKKLNLTIADDSNIFFSASLFDFVRSKNIPLGDISAGLTKSYTWTVNFDPTVGNKYQGLSTIFNIDYLFSCDDTINTESASLLTQDDGQILGVSTANQTATLTISQDNQIIPTIVLLSFLVPVTTMPIGQNKLY